MYEGNAMKEDSERRYRWVERWLRDDDRMKKDLVGRKIFQFDNNMVESGDKENTVGDIKKEVRRWENIQRVSTRCLVLDYETQKVGYISFSWNKNGV